MRHASSPCWLISSIPRRNRLLPVRSATIPRSVSRSPNPRLDNGFSPLGFARIYASLGEADAAFRWLESAYEVRWALLPNIRVETEFASLRDDPRFQDLLRRIGFPES